MTENVYVIKVKTKPPLSSLYPSERRYSASTVGGLSLVHFGLGTLSLLLGTLALSLQGPILFVACLVPFVTGLLAWRRWYIDRNIAIFFYGNLFSLVAAILCFIVTIFDVAAASNSTNEFVWPLEKILDTPHYSPHPTKDFTNETYADIMSTEDHSFNFTKDYDFLKINNSSKLPITFKSPSIEFNTSDFDINAKNHNDPTMTEASFMFEERMMISREIFQNKNTMNITEGSMNLTKEKTETFRHSHFENSMHARMLLTLNVLMTSLLEIFWSLLSAKIAFCGMMNQLPENGNVIVKSKTTRLPLQKRKPPAPKPDILDHDRRLSEALQNLQGLDGNGIGPRLPLPESNREFRERVERFLENQATDRIIEGA